MTADWIIAEADRLIAAHPSDGNSWADITVRAEAGYARVYALGAKWRLVDAANYLARAEVAHKGYGDVDAIADRILNGVSS